MTHAPAPADFVVHPSAGRRNNSWLAICGSAAAPLLFLLAMHGIAQLITAAFCVLLILWLVYYFARLRHRWALTVRDDTLYVHKIRPGERRVIARGEPGRVVVLDIILNEGKSMSSVSRKWLIVDASDRVLLSINRLAFDPSALETIQERLELSREPLRHYTAKEARARFQGLISIITVYPVWFSVLFVGGIFALAIGVGAAVR